MSVFLARQAILDRKKRVFGYELLFRSSVSGRQYDAVDGNQATSQVVGNSLFAFGLDKVTAGKPAFINFTRDLLLNDLASLLPPETIVVEVLESVEPDEEVIAACRQLKQRGYVLALDDFVYDDHLEPLTRVADIIKVDVQTTGRREQLELVRRFSKQGLKMLAEKVEAVEQFEWARHVGYTYFQGFFFARPVILSGQEPPAFKLHYNDLLREILRPELQFPAMEEVIRKELSLTYRLLRYINSPRFGWRVRVESIRHALALLGEEECRKWAALAIISSIGADKPQELVLTAMIRARFCELLGPVSNLTLRGPDLFLMGMFSLLDAIMDASLDVVLRQLPVSGDVQLALLGGPQADTPLTPIYTLVRAYEIADWHSVSSCAQAAGIDEQALPELYLQSVHWAEEIFTL